MFNTKKIALVTSNSKATFLADTLTCIIIDLSTLMTTSWLIEATDPLGDLYLRAGIVGNANLWF